MARIPKAIVAAGSLAAVLLCSAAQAGPPGSTVILTRPAGFGALTPPVVNDSASNAVGFDPAVSTVAAPGHRLVGGPGNTTRYVVFVSRADGISADDDNRFMNIFVRDRETGAVTLVSRATNGAAANADSYSPSISVDGTRVAFVSEATNLVPDNPGGSTQAYTRDLNAATTTLVSRENGAGGDPADAAAREPSISGDGSAVAFSSLATNLGGGSGKSQVYVRHGTTTTLVSVPDSSTTPGNGDSYSASLSDDGNHVAFSSEATNIGVTDANNRNDVFVHTISTGATALASVSAIAPGQYGDSDSDGPSISADGHRVAFVSYARNFSTLDADPAFTRDVYVHDFTANTTFLASRGGGERGNADSYDGSISGDGNRVAFLTAATNLSGADTNAVADVYVRDTSGGTSTFLASRCMGSALLSEAASQAAIAPNGNAVSFRTASAGCSPDQDNDFFQVFLRTLGLSVVDPTEWISRPSGSGAFRSGTNSSAIHGINRSDDSPSALSGDGSTAAFSSSSDEMSPDDDNRLQNIFARNAKTGETELISRATGANGAAANGPSSASAAISDDARYVAFSSAATNLVANDTNGYGDVFVRDRVAQTTTRVSVKSDGAALPHSSGDPDLSADGQRIAFTSEAQLDAADDDTDADIYVHDLATGTTTLVSVNSAGGHANQPSFSAAISGDGNRVAFLSQATNLWPFDGNAYADVYVRDLTAHTTKLVSARDASAFPGDSVALAAELDFTGAHIVFSSYASNLVGTNDGNGIADIFVREPDATKTTLVSGISATLGGNGFSDRPSISADGTRVAFQTGSTDLIPGDTDGVYDVAVRDLTTGITMGASRADGADGALPNRDALNPVLSANGHCVAFDSLADNLVAGPPGTDFVHAYLRALDADCGTPEAVPGPGPGPGPSPASSPDTTPPAISALKVAPSKFRIGAKRTAISAKKAPKGTKIRFTLSEAAAVSLRIQRRTTGHRKGKKCLAKRRTGKRCTIYKTKGTLKRSGRAGANSVAFSGRIGARKLAKGRYRIVATATDTAGNKAKQKTAAFRVV